MSVTAADNSITAPLYDVHLDGIAAPRVAVVILNWNGKAYLEKFLPSVLASTYFNNEIIVADNNSTDESVAFLRSAFPDVTVLVNESNLGFAKGYNAALRKINADYVVLLNSDVEVTPGWIEPVIALMERDQTIAACQPKILAYTQKNEFEYAGAAGGWIDKYGYPFARGRVFDVCETDLGQYDSVQQCFWATGAALFVRAETYAEVGGLDEYFFAHQEEIDLCWRLQLAGWKIFAQPASIVYHVGGGTLATGSDFKTFLNFRNGLIMLYKNLPLRKALRTLWIRLLLDAVAAWKGLLTGHPGYFIAIVKAHVHFVGWFCFHQKKSVFPKQTAGTVHGRYKGSIVWDFFIRKKRTFSQIISDN